MQDLGTAKKQRGPSSRFGGALKVPKSSPKVLDLFAGCGGLSAGLRRAGFDVAWANEMWPAAAATYRSTHAKTRLFEMDALELLAASSKGCDGYPGRGQVDLLVGGPPCQGFSGWNRFRAIRDARNSMVSVFLSFVEVLRPAGVIIENVTGILSLSGGKAAHSILRGLQESGYSVRLLILQAGCFGVPQNRWRVFFIGVRGDREIPLPDILYQFPRTVPFNTTKFRECVLRPTTPEQNTLGLLKKHRTVADAIDDLPPLKNGEAYSGEYNVDVNSEFQSLLRGNCRFLQNHTVVKLGPAYMDRIKALPKGSGASWVDLPEHLKPKNLARTGGRSYDNRFGRLRWSGIFNTIVSKPEPYWGRYIHPTQNRVLSVRESARAQAFPDSTVFRGSLKEQYLQVGNAVPPLLAEALGKVMRQLL